MSGAAAGTSTDQWLHEGHRLAKAITNAVANRWGDGPDTPAGVRARLAVHAPTVPPTVRARMDDETLAVAIAGVQTVLRRWAETPPGGVLPLEWPLPGSFFTGSYEEADSAR